MDFSATHAGFVIAAYALSAAVLGGLFIATMARDRWNSRELRKFESVRREDRA